MFQLDSISVTNANSNDIIFQTILMTKAILAKSLSQKTGQLEHSYIKHALGLEVV